MKVTLSVIKADVGSIGGHTRPSVKMVDTVEAMLKAEVGKLLIDARVDFTGDDIKLVMSHRNGEGAKKVHKLAWDAFKAATAVAQEEGCYGAGQDLLVDAPSGNLRGAGPGVAEIEFELNPAGNYRPAEAFLIFAADKCGPGAFNLPLYLAFCDVMHNGGLLLNPKMRAGFTFTVIDMDHTARMSDRIINFDVPEHVWEVAVLLQNPDRYAVEFIYSRYKKHEKIAAVSATRLHNIAGKYTGKDDPVVLVRTQGIFPAPEELVEPYLIAHYVTGDARGSHVMPFFPTKINTPVTGPYCHPLVSCLAFSMNSAGKFSHGVVDMFEGHEWDEVRRRSQEKALEMRKQGFFGAAMASEEEIAYTGMVEARKALDKRFVIRKENKLK